MTAAVFQHGPGSDAPGRLFVGLMSGTSMDGVDAVLARFAPDAPPEVLAGVSLPMPALLRDDLMRLNAPGENELARAALSGNALAALYAQAVRELLAQTGLPASAVTAIGAHGQTVRHQPDMGFTVQLNNPSLLAELAGIAVVADFRSRDVAAGGQGAPLVPPFHAALFGRGVKRVVLNLGGMANVTLLAPGMPARGFDTGPANVLLDAWCLKHTGRAFDTDGAWAASGQPDGALLAALLEGEPWFALPPPKSTGRERFNLAWLEQRLEGRALRAQDVQATLLRLTARTVADAVNAALPQAQEVLVCGGGVRNVALMHALGEALRRPVRATDAVGVSSQWMEALAFAWLAQMRVDGLPASSPDVTGASGPRVLGALYHL